MSFAGIQAIKLFGRYLWPVNGYNIFHSGCPKSGDRERATRNEGVGIALDGGRC